MSEVCRLDVERVVRFYETLSPESLVHIGKVYAPDARFKDPFNDVQGLAAIEAVFRHMFRQVQEPRFCVTSRLAVGHDAWLEWEFHFRFRRWRETEIQLVRGATRLELSPEGHVLVHRDYWDTGEELFARLPVMGALVRFLQRRLSAPGPQG